MPILQDESKAITTTHALQMDFHGAEQIPTSDASKLHHLYFAQCPTTVLAIDRHFLHIDKPHVILADNDQNF